MVVGFAVTLLMLIMISITVVQTESNEYYILQVEDVVMIRGGVYTGGGASSGKSASVRPIPDKINIPLNSRPYICQEFHLNNTANILQEVYQLQVEDVALIRGGAPIIYGEAGGGKYGSSSGSTSGINIPLKNVPYVKQYLSPYDGRSSQEDINRSAYYCGIASALMVRGKMSKDTNFAQTLYDSAQGYNLWNVDIDMKNMDTYLKNGSYGSSTKPVDVKANLGLLYINSSLSDTATNWESQFNSTAGILEGVYLGKLWGTSRSDYVSVDNKNVTSVNMRPISASLKNSTKEISDATIAIWNHIKNYSQPVVVVVDSNKQVGRTVSNTQTIPTLHYIVIKGISESTSGGTRYFLVNDPAVYYDDLTYSEADLRTLMALPSNTRAWVYKHGNRKVGFDPAYILTVQGG